MDENKKVSHWWVILEKRPRGPLSESELRTLIAEGVLRLNDLALAVRENEPPTGGWKFLWQFPEFDRRNPEAAKASPIHDRRENENQVSSESKIKAIVPEEVAKIPIEDFALKVHRDGKSHFDDRSSHSNVLEFPGKPISSEPNLPSVGRTKTWKYLGILTLTGFALAFFIGRYPAEKVKARDTATVNEALIPSQELPTGNPLSFSQPHSSKLPGKMEKPNEMRKFEPSKENQEEADHGEIRADEMGLDDENKTTFSEDESESEDRSLATESFRKSKKASAKSKLKKTRRPPPDELDEEAESDPTPNSEDPAADIITTE